MKNRFLDSLRNPCETPIGILAFDVIKTALMDLCGEVSSKDKQQKDVLRLDAWIFLTSQDCDIWFEFFQSEPRFAPDKEVFLINLSKTLQGEPLKGVIVDKWLSWRDATITGRREKVWHGEAKSLSAITPDAKDLGHLKR